MRSFTSEAVWALRMRSQRLTPETTVESVPAVATALGGIQAQEKPAATLAVRPRTTGTAADDVDLSLHEDRTTVRTWCMRGTLHLVASTDLPWLLPLFGPHFAPRGPEPKQLAEMGFDDEELERTMAVVERVLATSGPLTRDELAVRLREAAVDVDPASRAPNVLVRQAALRGILCEVAPKGGDNAYGLLDEWVDVAEPPAREVALSTLARRYLAAYQPASLDDFAYWSGLPKRDVRAAWESVADETTTVAVDGTEMCMLADDVPTEAPTPTDSVVRLLPGYDTYLLGYSVANRPVPATSRSQVWPGAGVIRPTVVVDGAVVGTWRLERTGTPQVQVVPFESLADDVRRGIEAEVVDLGQFLELDPTLHVETA